MLEAAGEPWPIGSDGLSMKWGKDPQCIAGGSWRLRSKARATNTAHSKSEKGRATSLAYYKSEKGRATRARDKQKRIQINAGGLRFFVRVPPEKKEEIKQRLSEFRAEQQTRTKEVAENGWIY